MLLGLGDREGRTDAYQRLRAFAREQGQTPAHVLGRIANGEKLGLVVPALVRRCSHAMAKVAQLREMALPELIDALFPESQLAVADLRAVAIDTIAEAQTASDLLRAIVEAITQDTVPQHPDFVRVMSLHKAKGLTSPSVFVAGAIQGVLPTIVAKEEAARQAAVEEGRRLFYVAVTRASEELVISSALSLDLADAKARNVFYDRSHARPVRGRYVVQSIASQYLHELGPSAPRAIRGERWLQNR